MVRLEQRISLQQKLSPQHVLFSTLLQMPVLALEQKIKTELEQNPLLEESLDIDEQQRDDDLPDPAQEEMKDGEEESEVDDKDEKEEFSMEDFLNNDDDYEYKPVYKSREEEDFRPDPAPVTLTEHLLSQLHFLQLSEEDAAIGEYIIWNINEDGYLSAPVEVLADFLSTTNYKVDPTSVEKILKMIQILDPVGIGSRNLQECMLVQLLDNETSDPIAIRLVDEFFDDFKNKRYEKLVKNLGVDIEDVKCAIEAISRLNPKPGEGYINANENYIIPDILIEKVGNDYIPVINDTNVPQLRINNAYKRMLTEGSIPDDTKKYIYQRLESARWLINSIQQRKITMIRVTNEIITRQRDFFDKGQKHIEPMILKDIAEAISMDISTISRVTNGKYMQTDYGVFELKYFFTDKMTNDDGEEISTMKLKNQIRDIIENENSNKPLTDGHIAEMVADDGVPIARRTVAKYREQMKIPVARLRRKI